MEPLYSRPNTFTASFYERTNDPNSDFHTTYRAGDSNSPNTEYAFSNHFPGDSARNLVVKLENECLHTTCSEDYVPPTLQWQRLPKTILSKATMPTINQNRRDNLHNSAEQFNLLFDSSRIGEPVNQTPIEKSKVSLNNLFSQNHSHDSADFVLNKHMVCTEKKHKIRSRSRRLVPSYSAATQPPSVESAPSCCVYSPDSQSSNSNHGVEEVGSQDECIRKVKDAHYLDKRARNNVAAKRSRDNRKRREDSVALRASILEQSNQRLQAQLLELKREICQLRNIPFDPDYIGFAAESNSMVASKSPNICALTGSVAAGSELIDSTGLHTGGRKLSLASPTISNTTTTVATTAISVATSSQPHQSECGHFCNYYGQTPRAISPRYDCGPGEFHRLDPTLLPHPNSSLGVEGGGAGGNVYLTPDLYYQSSMPVHTQ